LAMKKNKAENTVKEYRRALWMKKSLNYRRRILLKTAGELILFQREFLDGSGNGLKDLSIRCLAQMSGFHESIVSRVTRNKFAATPRGRIEIRHLLRSDKKTVMIKEKIRSLIETDDGNRPLTDKRIAELLRKDNIIIARRTAAKYRKMMNIKGYKRRIR